jgi:uncharacterized membrane protein
MKHSLYTCSVCDKSFPRNKMISGELIRPEISKEIIRICPNWTNQHYICHEDLAVMRSRYIRHLLVSDKNDLTGLKNKVLNKLDDQSLLSVDMDPHLEQQLSFGDRLADMIANFGGSWKFLISFSIFMALWLGANSLIYLWQPRDPYPFIFLNLILSCLSAIQAPVIMMSQNRREAKDRVHAQHDYQVNLKAELEIRILHEKIDHLLSYQWEKMMEIEKTQLELLAELRST